MLKLNDKEVTINHFPDGTILLKGRPQKRIHEYSAVKEKIDRLHNKNLFKLEPIPSFPYA